MNREFLLPAFLLFGSAFSMAQSPREITAEEAERLAMAAVPPSVAKLPGFASDCGDSPRVVGLFGAMDRPVDAVPVSEAIRVRLSDVKVVRAVQHTSLADSGEQVLMYDTSADELAPEPKIAIIADDAVILTFDVPKLVAHGQQAIYRTSCQVELRQGQNGFAVAYTLSGDGTGSAFVVLAYMAGTYRVVFSRIVEQGQVLFDPGVLELWERSFDKHRANPESVNFECEWCAHRYLVTKYAWRNGEYVKTASMRTKATFDPAAITGTPINLRHSHQQTGR